jgi:hypothetical protein
MLGKRYPRMIELTLFRLDVIDIHNFDIMALLPLHILLFGSPNLNGVWTCRCIDGLKCCCALCGS